MKDVKPSVTQPFGNGEVRDNFVTSVGVDLLTEENGEKSLVLEQIVSDDVIADETVLLDGEPQLNLKSSNDLLPHQDDSLIKSEDHYSQSAMDTDEDLQHEAIITHFHDHSENKDEADEHAAEVWLFVKYLLVVDECLAVLDPWLDFIISSVSSEQLTLLYNKLFIPSVICMPHSNSRSLLCAVDVPTSLKFMVIACG